MKKTIGLLLLFSLLGMGQQSSITLTVPPPQSVGNVSVSRVGAQGNSQYYYWVIANYSIGQTVSSPFTVVVNAPDNPSGSNYEKISWNLLSGATSYDVLRTTTNYIPATCTCAVTTGNTTGTVNDQTNTLGVYNYMPVGSTVAHIKLDTNFSQGRLLIDAPINPTLFANLPLAGLSKGLIYLVTDAGSTSTCTVGGGTNTPALCWSNGSTWIPIGGGGGSGSTPSYTVVPWTATPTYSLTSPIMQGFAITLAGNTTVTVSGSPTLGQEVWLKTCENATGGWTFTLPANFTRQSVIDTTANVCTSQVFKYDGTNYVGVTNGYSDNSTPALVTSTGVLLLPTGNDTLAGLAAANVFTGNQTFGNITVNGTCTGCGAGGAGVGTLFTGTFGSSTTTASSTTYTWIQDRGSPGTAEANYFSIMPAACTAKNLFVVMATTQDTSGSLTFTLMHNSTQSTLQVVVPANGVAQTYKDITHTVSFAQGDTISLQIINAATVTSGYIRGWGVQCN